MRPVQARGIVLSPHLLERMHERTFTELELRAMLDEAEGYRPSITSGRFLIATRRERERWEIVVEPDEREEVLIIVTAYKVQ